MQTERGQAHSDEDYRNHEPLDGETDRPHSESLAGQAKELNQDKAHVVSFGMARGGSVGKVWEGSYRTRLNRIN